MFLLEVSNGVLMQIFTFFHLLFLRNFVYDKSLIHLVSLSMSLMLEFVLASCPVSLLYRWIAVVNKERKGEERTKNCMAFPIPDRVKRLWDEWNLRAAVLISLFFQVVLICCATSRKRTGNMIVTATIWLFYLLADWFAAFAVGLISNGQSNNCPEKFAVNQDLAAFWAPFLLLHLGGPDNITAFSLEDNELWIRHLLGLIIQLAAVAYVFSQSLRNVFEVPTILLIFAGTIKYAERTRALYLACLGNIKDSMLPPPDAGPNYAQLMEEYTSKEAAQVPVEIEIVKEHERGTQTSANPEEENLSPEDISDIDIVQNGYEFFTTFRGLIVDHMFSLHERSKSRKFFFQRSAFDAFRVMEVELNFIYDTLYTKMAVVHSKKVREKLSCSKRWSNTIWQCNLINFCMNQRWRWLDIAAETVGIKDVLDEMYYKEDIVIPEDLKDFIFNELKVKATKAKTTNVAKEIYSARGDWALLDYTSHYPYPTISSSVGDEVEFDESLLLWHIATELCYCMSPDDGNSNRNYCKLISDYMLYLLVMRPNLMSAVAGIGQIRFRDTCEEAKKFFSRWKSELIIRTPGLGICRKLITCCIAQNGLPGRESSSVNRKRNACEMLDKVNALVKAIEVKGDRSKSVLFDACRLAKDLKKLNDNKRWEIMSKVWVELLSYAASHCRANAHAQQLSKGGELITFVWILMAHFGLGEQFRIEAGHARAKLIVGK
nr:uncharacterized protein LOC113737786 isoform X1 [Coffea arabica]